MDSRTVVLKLNQQQLELLDRTVARGTAPDRVSLVKLALREYAAHHAPEPVRPDPAPAGVAA